MRRLWFLPVLGAGLILLATPLGRAATTTAYPWTETVLYAFGGTDGSGPSGLTEHGGAFYGTTAGGGAYAQGTVFQLLPPARGQTAWRERVLYSFTGGADGGQPMGGVIADARGALYGTTYSNVGGGFCNNQDYIGCGAVFELAPPKPGQTAWTETTLYSFAGGTDGGVPNGGLVADARGGLSGTTVVGGFAGCTYPPPTAACGVVFHLAPPTSGAAAWTESVLYAFSGYYDGAFPDVGLIADASGTLYGMTQQGFTTLNACGGLTGCGTVFALGGTRGFLYAFTGGIDGSYPGGSLALDERAGLYVSNHNGGSHGRGVVFQLTAGTVRVIHNFGDTPTDGIAPSLSNRADARGALYGATAGGPRGGGTVFRLVPPAPGKRGWTERLLYAFSGHADGGNPVAAFVFDANGALYGTTGGGGKGYGVVFKLAGRT